MRAIVLEAGADAAQVKRRLVALGLGVTFVGESFAVIDAHAADVAPSELVKIPGVREVLASKSEHPRIDEWAGKAVDVAGVRIGFGEAPVMMAGPCSVESETQIHAVASKLASCGVVFLRGGAFKPRTSPYAFQGHGTVALEWLSSAARANGMRVVTEVLSERDVESVSAHADLLQIGSRNMQNFALLKAAAASRKPVLLKRGAAATIEEWLLAGEYALLHGAAGVIFCERGIRGFDPSTRNLLDLGAVALLASVKRLAVVVDPSHAVGRRDLVAPLASAGLAAGAAGVMIETHEDPGRALSDGAQAVPLAEMPELLARWLPPARERRGRGAS